MPLIPFHPNIDELTNSLKTIFHLTKDSKPGEMRKAIIVLTYVSFLFLFIFGSTVAILYVATYGKAEDIYHVFVPKKDDTSPGPTTGPSSTSPRPMPAACVFPAGKVPETSEIDACVKEPDCTASQALCEHFRTTKGLSLAPGRSCYDAVVPTLAPRDVTFISDRIASACRKESYRWLAPLPGRLGDEARSYFIATNCQFDPNLIADLRRDGLLGPDQQPCFQP